MLVHEDEAERAAQVRQHLERGRLEGAVGVAGQQRGDQGGVGGVAARQLAGRAAGVALGDEHRAARRCWSGCRCGRGRRCRRPWRRASAARSARCAAGRRVAAVADGEVPVQRGQRASRRRPGRPGPCPCRRGSCRRRWWRCRRTPARGAAARRGRSR